MTVYRTLQVDIPKSRVTIEKQKNGKPALIKYVIEAPFNREKGYPEPKRTTIGHQCPDSRTKMYPTSQYKKIFPKKWEELTKEKVSPATKKMGLFTLAQAVNMKTGIKDILDEIYGPETAGALMEQAFYSILYHSNAASGFTQLMEDELLYSSSTLSDSYFADLFSHRMSQEQEMRFKDAWAKECQKNGAEDVWLCIDGSNDDCTSQGVDLAEKGIPKSRHNSNIISFTYAVTADGRPVAYELYRGGLVDFKAMKSVIDHLTESGFHLNGVILDRGYCNSDVFHYLHDLKIPYIVMVKGCPVQCTELWDSYASRIKMNVEYLVEDTCLFAIQQKMPLYASLDWEDYITLYFDYQNASERVTALLKNLYKTRSKVLGQIQKGREISIESKYEEFLVIDGDKVSLNTRSLQKAVDKKGLYSIVCSEDFSPLKIHTLYQARSAAELQFRTMKTQLGYGTVRVQSTPAERAKFLTGFIASVIRHELEAAARDTGKSTDQMIHEADKLVMQKLNDSYIYTHTESERLKGFIENLGVENVMELIDESVTFENNRLAGRTVTPRKRKTGTAKGSHRKQVDENGQVIHKKPGVKTGTVRSAVNKDGTPRKKPGVPAGTKRSKYNKDGSLRKKPGPKAR